MTRSILLPPASLHLHSLTATEVAGSLAPLGVAASAGEPLLPQPSRSVDVSEAIARMVIETAFERKRQVRADRTAARTEMAEAQKAQLVHMREKADATRGAAQAEAWGRIAGGGLGIAGALLPLGQGEDGKGNGWAATGQALSAGSQSGTGVGGLVAAPFSLQAAHADANAKADEMRVAAEKEVIDEASDDMRELDDRVRSALDFMREYRSTEAKSASAVSLRA